MSDTKRDKAISQAHSCEVWVELSDAELISEPLEEALVHCSYSLKALFQDIEKSTGKRFIRELLAYVASGTPEHYAAICDGYKEARTAAAAARSWDYGKGPYLLLSSADAAEIQGRVAKISSRCQTVTLTVERANTKFPAKPGENNVPQLRATLQINPNDAAKFDSCFAMVKELSVGFGGNQVKSKVLFS